MVDSYLHNIPRLVLDEMNEMLYSPITGLEIIVENLGIFKALNVNGLNGFFYKQDWQVVGSALCMAVKDVF